MEAGHWPDEHCSVIQAEKEALPHAGVNVVERAWRAVKVGVQGRCVGPEVVADARCPVAARGRTARLSYLPSCCLAGLVFVLPV